MIDIFTSIFEGQPSKTRPFSNQNKGHSGSRQILGTPDYLSIHCKSKAIKNSPPGICWFINHYQNNECLGKSISLMASKDPYRIYLIGQVHQSGDSWMYPSQRIEALKKVGYLWVIHFKSPRFCTKHKNNCPQEIKMACIRQVGLKWLRNHIKEPFTMLTLQQSAHKRIHRRQCRLVRKNSGENISSYKPPIGSMYDIFAYIYYMKIKQA